VLVQIRECRSEDLDVVEAAIPSGPSRFHHRRFARQQEGRGTYLIAWLDGAPAGHAEIRWDGCDAADVLTRFPDCPELNGLGIWPQRLRSRGIGTALIGACERRAADRGLVRLGLGVADDNPRAAALYLRLSYQETGCRYLDQYEIRDPAGARHLITEPCRFLIKDLSSVAGHAATHRRRRRWFRQSENG
jgi:GNAT superfamily N-acetyltransferase